MRESLWIGFRNKRKERRGAQPVKQAVTYIDIHSHLIYKDPSENTTVSN